MDWLNMELLFKGMIGAGFLTLALPDGSASAALKKVLGMLGNLNPLAASDPAKDLRAANEAVRAACSKRGAFANCEVRKQKFELLDEYDALLDELFPKGK